MSSNNNKIEKSATDRLDEAIARYNKIWENHNRMMYLLSEIEGRLEDVKQTHKAVKEQINGRVITIRRD